MLREAELIQAELALEKASEDRQTVKEREISLEGTLLARVEAIASQLCIPKELVSDIAGGKFVAFDLALLNGSMGALVYDTTTIYPSLINGTLTFTYGHAQIADFKGNVWHWNVGFTNYITVWEELIGETYPKTVITMASFFSYMLRQQKVFTAPPCNGYGCNRWTAIMQRGIDKATSWKEKLENLVEC